MAKTATFIRDVPGGRLYAVTPPIEYRILKGGHVTGGKKEDDIDGLYGGSYEETSFAIFRFYDHSDLDVDDDDGYDYILEPADEDGRPIVSPLYNHYKNSLPVPTDYERKKAATGGVRHVGPPGGGDGGLLVGAVARPEGERGPGDVARRGNDLLHVRQLLPPNPGRPRPPDRFLRPDLAPEGRTKLLKLERKRGGTGLPPGP
jgi:hypothetical protein